MVAGSYKSLNDTPFAQALCEQTGVAIEFIHAPQGEEHERLDLMIASDTMPDIVEYNWASGYIGGISQAIYDGL